MGGGFTVCLDLIPECERCRDTFREAVQIGTRVKAVVSVIIERQAAGLWSFKKGEDRPGVPGDQARQCFVFITFNNDVDE